MSKLCSHSTKPARDSGRGDARDHDRIRCRMVGFDAGFCESNLVAFEPEHLASGRGATPHKQPQRAFAQTAEFVEVLHDQSDLSR